MISRGHAAARDGASGLRSSASSCTGSIGLEREPSAAIARARSTDATDLLSMNTRVKLRRDDGRPSQAVVRWVDTAHHDLRVIAVEHAHRRHFAGVEHTIGAKPVTVVVSDLRYAA